MCLKQKKHNIEDKKKLIKKNHPTITLIIYSKQMPGLDGPPYYCVPAICVSIQYNREKYIEMAKYPFNEEEICKEYINHGDLNIRMGKLREEMK